MMQNTTRNIADESCAADEADLAATRSFAYMLFSSAFEYPEDSRLELMRQGAPSTELKSVITAIAPDLVAAADWDALSRVGEGDDLQVEYTRLFDAGASGPPCSLHEGAHRKSRMGTLEELVRFYNYFGLSRAEEPNDLPDHLSTQLEFMHYLSHCEAILCRDGDDPADYQRAQRDFLIHHPGQWVLKLKNKLADNAAHDYFLELGQLLNAFLRHDMQHLIALVGRGKQDATIPLATIEDLPTKPEQEAEFEDSEEQPG